MPQFKAQPLPHFDTVVLPEKKKLESTKPEPFRLLLDERGAVKSCRWEQMVRQDLPRHMGAVLCLTMEFKCYLCALQVKEEQKQQEEATIFKARPNIVTHKEPFQPRKESRPAVGKTTNMQSCTTNH